MGNAAIVIVKRGPLVVAVTNRKYGRLGLPGGKQEKNETIFATAQRELAEESGYSVALEDLFYLTQGKSCVDGHIVHVFWARCVVGLLGAQEKDTIACFTTWSNLLENSPFKEFYLEHFPKGVRHLLDTDITELE